MISRNISILKMIYLEYCNYNTKLTFQFFTINKNSSKYVFHECFEYYKIEFTSTK